jgi:hypothetical protein
MLSRRKIIVMSGALLCLAVTAWADAPIYKWVDDQGKVHYSSVPHGDNSQQLKIVNKGSGVTPAAGVSTQAAPASDDKNLTTATPSDSATCKAARDTLTKYLGADYLYTLDAKGEKQKMPKDQQEQTITQAKAAVTQACKS